MCQEEDREVQIIWLDHCHPAAGAAAPGNGIYMGRYFAGSVKVTNSLKLMKLLTNRAMVMHFHYYMQDVWR